MTRQEICDSVGREHANTVTRRLEKAGLPCPRLAIQLGDGFELSEFKQVQSFPLRETFSGLHDLPELDPPRAISYGFLPWDIPVLVTPRISLHERNPVTGRGDARNWVRLLNDTLVFAGCTRLVILTEAGSINAFIPGDLVTVRSVSTIFMRDWPMYQGEACQPDRALSRELALVATQASIQADVDLKMGKHVYWHGPGIETEDDKRIIRQLTAAELISMSVLPDLAVWALHPDTAVLPLALVTNGINNPFNLEHNQRHVAESKERITPILSKLIPLLAR
ncbi:hypothetical protein HYW18_00260 [Candidatus Uhrbacteria bacterium]|nr:hypothetical protein [Candidatus Uhrbacteria bacterium]